MSIVKLLHILFHILFFALFIWWGIIWYQGSTTGIQNYFFNLALSLSGLYAGVLVFLKFLKWRNLKRSFALALLFFSLAVTFWSIGALTYSYYNFGGFSISSLLSPQPIEEVPYPGIADMFYGLFPIFSFLGIFCLNWPVWSRNQDDNFRKLMFMILVPLLVLTVGILAFVNIITVRPIDLSDPLPSVAAAMDFYYNAGDSLILAFSCVMLLSLSYFRRVKFGKALLFLILGFVGIYFADFFFFYRFNKDEYFIGDYPDLLYAITLYCVSLGGLLFNEQSKSDQDVRQA